VETAPFGYQDARSIVEKVATKAVRRGRAQKDHRENGKLAASSRTDQQSKLLEVATSISGDAPGGDDMAFVHAILCQVGLPRSKVIGREFLRQSGGAWVNIQAGWLDEGRGPVQQPVPYGVMPRLALAWLSTYAVRNHVREIPIGESAAAFLHIMGLDNQGDKA
jgi:hypothetical protein